MKIAFRQFLLSPLVVTVFLVTMASICGLVLAAMIYQRQDFRQTMDANAAQNLVEFKKALNEQTRVIRKLQVQDMKSAEERDKIEKSIKNLKEEVGTVPFIRVREAIKKAGEQARP